MDASASADHVLREAKAVLSEEGSKSASEVISSLVLDAVDAIISEALAGVDFKNPQGVYY